MFLKLKYLDVSQKDLLFGVISKIESIKNILVYTKLLGLYRAELRLYYISNNEMESK